MAGELILIIEDNEKNQKLVRDVLQVKGYQTLETDTAEEGHKLAVENHPAIILMDIQHPGNLFLIRQHRDEEIPRCGTEAGTVWKSAAIGEHEADQQSQQRAFERTDHHAGKIGLSIRFLPKTGVEIGQGARVTLRVLFNLLKRDHTEPPALLSQPG